MRLLKYQRWSRKLLIGLAALPICQAATCDPQTLANLAATTGLSLATQLNATVFQLVIVGAQQTLLNAFPGANILQILLGGNSQPFFP